MLMKTDAVASMTSVQTHYHRANANVDYVITKSLRDRTVIAMQGFEDVCKA